MLLATSVLLPILAALIALFPIGRGRAVGLLIGTATLHTGLVFLYWVHQVKAWAPFLHLDPLGHLFLSLISGLFLMAAIYSVGYLEQQSREEPNGYRRYVPCLLFLLAAATLVTVTEHLAVLWAAIEATTLASAPLIYFHKRRAALEATWKFLLLCSVGIALALLGTFFLGIAASGTASTPTLTFAGLSNAALAPQWLKVAFVLALVGYGTKMGLAPLHTWLPDTYAQAPSPVSAFFSGALINCALLGVLRFFQICVAAGMDTFARPMLLALGFVSLGVAAAFILGQRDFKRLFAYSSVENMGIIAIGVGVGGTASFGAMLHVVNHGMLKAALFFLAGNLVAIFGTTRCDEVRGVVRKRPTTGILLVLATLAIGGAPPFGAFLSEWVIFRQLIGSSPSLAALFAALLGTAFLGLVAGVLPMAQGEGRGSPKREAWSQVGPPLVLLCAVLGLGLYLPPPLGQLLRQIGRMLGGSA